MFTRFLADSERANIPTDENGGSVARECRDEEREEIEFHPQHPFSCATGRSSDHALMSAYPPSDSWQGIFNL